MFEMWIVFLLLLMCFTYIYSNRLKYKTVQILTFIGLAVFILIIGFRPFELSDTAAYVVYFKGIENLSFEFVWKKALLGGRSYGGMEGGFLLFSYLLYHMFGGSIRAYFILIALIQTTIYLYATLDILDMIERKKNNQKRSKGLSENTIFKRKDSLVLIAVTFISYYGLYYESIVLRAGLCISLMVLIIDFIMKKKFVLAVALGCICFYIQRMSIVIIIIAIVYFLVPVLSKRRYYYFLLFLYTIVMFSSLTNVLAVYFEPYLRMILSYVGLDGYFGYFTGAKDALVGKTEIWKAFLMFCFISSSEFKEINYRRMINVIFFGFLANVITKGISGAGRITDLFYIFEIPLLYYLFEREIYKITFAGGQKKYFCLIVVFVNVFIYFRIIG